MHHTYTRDGSYTVSLTATGVDGKQSVEKLNVTVKGAISTVNDANQKHRYQKEDWV